LLKILTILLASATTALAQSNDQYWQQLIGNNEARCAQTIVNLAKQLDDANKQISDLKKQLEEKK